ncbi:MAG: SpoIIE family protein phosphatase [Planctomycetaceae bacterium]
MASIVFLRGGQTIRFQLGETDISIGRHADADIRLEQDHVSRRHARIFRCEGAWQLEDMNSTGGTNVNGKKLLPETPVILRHQDDIRIGSNKLVFESAAKFLPPPQKITTAEIEISDDSDSSVEGSASSSGYGQLSVRPEEKLAGILKINEALAGNVDLRAICPLVLDTLFDIFFQTDRGAIMLLQKDSNIPVPVAQRHRNTDDSASVRISRVILDNVLKTNSAILSANTSIDPRMSGSDSIMGQAIQSTMCAPMLGVDGKAFGIIHLDSQDPRQRFCQEDLQLLLAVASQASHAFENARLLTMYMQKLKQDEEMKISAQVQRALIPEILPQPAGYQFYGSYDAAAAVGGDYFDCFEMPDGKICVSFGDVAGKGVPAALIMSRLSGIVRNTMNFTDDVGLAMCQINSLMCNNMIDGRFVTYLLGVIDPKTHVFTFANAGHMPPEIRSPHGVLSNLGTEDSGLPLGIDKNCPFPTSTIQLAAGTSIILRTDGVDDAMSSKEDFYGSERFRKVVRAESADPEAIGRAILMDVKAFMAGYTQHDDITIMSFGRLHQNRVC